MRRVHDYLTRSLRRKASTYSVVLAGLILASCADLDERLQARIDANDGRIPQAFDAPDSAGLLIVDVEMRHEGSLTWGRNIGENISDVIIRRSDTRQTIHSRPQGGFAFFQLAPGTYELVTVNSSAGNVGPGQYVQAANPFLASEGGFIPIALGQVTYFGKLTITAHSKLGQLGLTYTYDWSNDKTREREALEVFERRHSASPWSPIVQSRLADIN